MSSQHLVGSGKFVVRKNCDDDEKPIEDFALVDNTNSIFIVCDGVTRSLINGEYPVPSPSAQASRIFAETVHQALVNLLPTNLPREALEMAVKDGNKAIAQFNKRNLTQIDYLENDLAGTVAIVGIIVDNKFYYAYNGDCYGYLISENRASSFTSPQTTKVAAYRRQVGFGREATIEIRRDFRNNKQHPFGYGVFTGEISAIDFVEYGSISLVDGQKIILVSDGVIHLFNSDPKLLHEDSPEIIVSEAEKLETQLGIRSDDKAIIIIQITQVLASQGT